MKARKMQDFATTGGREADLQPTSAEVCQPEELATKREAFVQVSNWRIGQVLDADEHAKDAVHAIRLLVIASYEQGRRKRPYTLNLRALTNPRGAKPYRVTEWSFRRGKHLLTGCGVLAREQPKAGPLNQFARDSWKTPPTASYTEVPVAWLGFDEKFLAFCVVAKMSPHSTPAARIAKRLGITAPATVAKLFASAIETGAIDTGREGHGRRLVGRQIAKNHPAKKQPAKKRPAQATSTTSTSDGSLHSFKTTTTAIITRATAPVAGESAAARRKRERAERHAERSARFDAAVAANLATAQFIGRTLSEPIAPAPTSRALPSRALRLRPWSRSPLFRQLLSGETDCGSSTPTTWTPLTDSDYPLQRWLETLQEHGVDADDQRVAHLQNPAGYRQIRDIAGYVRALITEWSSNPNSSDHFEDATDDQILDALAHRTAVALSEGKPIWSVAYLADSICRSIMWNDDEPLNGWPTLAECPQFDDFLEWGKHLVARSAQHGHKVNRFSMLDTRQINRLCAWFQSAPANESATEQAMEQAMCATVPEQNIRIDDWKYFTAVADALLRKNASRG